jgi:hypothetical protein
MLRVEAVNSPNQYQLRVLHDVKIQETTFLTADTHNPFVENDHI